MSESTRNKNKEYQCIHCGQKIENLFKEYSPSVVKLTDCKLCHNVADKYVEYDIMILIIDMILLQKEAYRHMLFNAHFKNLWKFAFILLLMEAFSDWTFNSLKPNSLTDDNLTQKNASTAEALNKLEFEVADFEFYKICLKIMIETLCFVSVLYILTVLYCKFLKNDNSSNNSNITSFRMIWKMVIMSNFGMFLLLPTLIWDTTVKDVHLSVVALYIGLTQLLAYTVLSRCPKLWSIFAIFVSYYCKTFFFDFVEIGFFAINHRYL